MDLRLWGKNNAWLACRVWMVEEPKAECYPWERNTGLSQRHVWMVEEVEAVFHPWRLHKLITEIVFFQAKHRLGWCGHLCVFDWDVSTHMWSWTVEMPVPSGLWNSLTSRFLKWGLCAQNVGAGCLGRTGWLLRWGKEEVSLWTAYCFKYGNRAAYGVFDTNIRNHRHVGKEITPADKDSKIEENLFKKKIYLILIFTQMSWV